MIPFCSRRGYGAGTSLGLQTGQATLFNLDLFTNIGNHSPSLVNHAWNYNGTSFSRITIYASVSHSFELLFSNQWFWNRDNRLSHYRTYFTLHSFFYYLSIVFLLNALVSCTFLRLGDPWGFPFCNQSHCFYLEPKQCELNYQIIEIIVFWEEWGREHSGGKHKEPDNLIGLTCFTSCTCSFSLCM